MTVLLLKLVQSKLVLVWIGSVVSTPIDLEEIGFSTVLLYYLRELLASPFVEGWREADVELRYVKSDCRCGWTSSTV